jgi:hypothetical protein
MNDQLNLPDPGTARFWSITHQPNKKTLPLRIELRQKTIPSAENTSLSLSSLVGFEDTVADETVIRGAAETILARVGRVDEFVGVYETSAKKKLRAV